MLNWLKDKLSRAPDPNWIEQQNQEGELTPDWWNISECEQQLYFAYGEDMPGRSVFPGLIGNEAFQLGPVYTSESLCVFQRSENAEGDKFAVALETEMKYNYPPAPLSSVRGELLSVAPSTFRKLDKFFDRGTAFNRRRVYVYYIWAHATKIKFGIPERASGVKKLAAWTYVGNPTFWNERITNYNFEPVKRQDNPCGVKNYYYYGDAA